MDNGVYHACPPALTGCIKIIKIICGILEQRLSISILMPLARSRPREMMPLQINTCGTFFGI